MNEQLQNSLAQIIEKATTCVQSGISFLSAEIPDVVHQLLVLKMAEAGVYLIIGLIMLIGSLLVFRVVSQAEEGEILHESELGVIAIMVSSGLVTVSMIMITVNTLTIIKIWVAPKAYLIEYAAELVK